VTFPARFRHNGDVPSIPRRWLALIIALCLGVAVVAYVLLGPRSHEDPDPGGQTLAALGSVAVAVPDDATSVLRQDVAPHWDSCDGREGTFGFSDIGVYVSFGTSTPPDKLLSRANVRLQESGWSPDVTMNTPLGPVGTWTRTLADGSVARAQLGAGTSDNGQTITWNLSAIAPPHGQRVSGC
jgi:hypothetical protein